MKLRRRSLWYSWYELFSSMRFAVGLLTVLAIASMIGSILNQNEPYPNYAFKFGLFWFEIYKWLGLYDVYHSSWFLLILAFLILSTALCVIRNAPKFLRSMQQYRENASERSLKYMAHSRTLSVAHPETALTILTHYLTQQGFRFKQKTHPNGIVVLAAKKGAFSKFGYLFAHIGLIVICLGGIMDGNLPLKIRELIGITTPETRDNILVSAIPPQSRLASNNLSFRGNVTIPEGRQATVAILNAGEGYLVQELPFILSLKKFHVDYYSTGMPKRFASDLIITDKATGKTQEVTIQVNHPAIIDGIAIYQSSFGDGGSPISFQAWNLRTPTDTPVPISGQSLSNQSLVVNRKSYTLELGELRLHNIETFAPPTAQSQSWAARLRQAQGVKTQQVTRNDGPSLTFKIRDAEGQAVEFIHYIAPIMQDNQLFLMAGVRKTVSEPFRYVRLPLDEKQSLERFMRLRMALMTPELLAQAAGQITRQAITEASLEPDRQKYFHDMVQNVLQTFSQGGFSGIEQSLKNVPKQERDTITQLYIKTLQGSIVDVMALADKKAGLPVWPVNNENYPFLLDSLVAFDSLRDYPAPVFLQVNQFKPIQASGLQLTRSPGKNLVYVGSLLLIIGTILMFYIREVRLWLRLQDHEARLAITSNRQNQDLQHDFERHISALSHLLGK